MDTSIEQDLNHYQRLRTVQRGLNSILMDRLPKGAEVAGGRALGIYRNGVLVFDSEDETSVLYDYCIYDHWWDGQNVIARYVAEAAIEPGSDEQTVLEAMLGARYSLFAIDEVVKGVGVQTRDLLRGDGGFVVDMSLSRTGVKGLVMAGRILSPRDCRFSMFTGAALPADGEMLKGMGEEIRNRFGKTTADIARLSPERMSELSAFVIRTLLAHHASSHVRHELGFGGGVVRPKIKIGRNEPCPCGSGRKYKRCCGKTAIS